MDNRVTDLGARVQALRTEVSIIQRKREEEASKAYRALQSISAEDVEALLPIVPQLRVIITYSVEDILANSNNEIKNIQEVMEQLRSYLEKRLDFYEGEL